MSVKVVGFCLSYETMTDIKHQVLMATALFRVPNQVPTSMDVTRKFVPNNSFCVQCSMVRTYYWVTLLGVA